jgi:hypothetical protein
LTILILVFVKAYPDFEPLERREATVSKVQQRKWKVFGTFLDGKRIRQTNLNFFYPAAGRKHPRKRKLPWSDEPNFLQLGTSDDELREMGRRSEINTGNGENREFGESQRWKEITCEGYIDQVLEIWKFEWATVSRARGLNA